MRISIRDEDGEPQVVKITPRLEEICIHHLLGYSRRRPFPIYMVMDVNSCYGCIPDGYNKHCPRYISLHGFHVFEILDER